MEKWVVRVSEAQLDRLDSEQRRLGTLLRNDEGETYLVFRDGFVALKIASQLGARRLAGRSVAPQQAQAHTPLAQFANGDVLVGNAVS